MINNSVGQDIYDQAMKNTGDYITEEVFKKIKAEAKKVKLQIESTISRVEEYEKDYSAIADAYDDVRKIINKPSQWETVGEARINKYKKQMDDLKGKYILNGQSIEEQFIKMYNTLVNFQKEILNYLGQSIETVIVSQDAEGEPILYKVKSEDILSVGMSSDRHLISRYQSLLKNVNNNTLKAISLSDLSNLGINNLEGLSGLQKTYKIVKQKYAIGLAAKKKGQGVKILWRDSTYKSRKRWLGLTVYQQGDLEEAYATVIFQNELEKFTGASNLPYKDGEALDNYVGFYMYNYVKKVDNLSGMFKGDTSFIDKNNKTIQIAVKSLGASAMGYKQIVKLIDALIKEEGAMSREELIKKIDQSEGGQRNKAISKISERIEAVSERVVQNYLSKVVL